MQTIQADPAGLASAGSKTLASRTTGEADRLEGGRILLIDPSEKGAMPLYTGMVAEGLRAVGLRPVVLGSRYLVAPDLAISWTILRVLPIDRWPPSPGARPASALRQAATWLGCALTIMAATLVLRPKIVHFQHPIHPRLDFLLLRA